MNSMQNPKESISGCTNDEVVCNDKPSIQELSNNSKEARVLKERGNEYFTKKMLTDAIDSYSRALEIAPDGDEIRSILYSNRAACHVALKEWGKAIEDASSSLELNPANEKSLVRRALAYEEEGKLEEAVNDLKKLNEINPNCSTKLKQLEQKLKFKREKEQEEMIGQLKDVGNKFLGMFGLSLDNFKTEKDENTGGYKINFQK